MITLFGFGLVLILGLYLLGLYRAGRVAALLKTVRLLIGAGALGFAALMAIGGRYGPAGIAAALGISVLVRGQLGPIDLRSSEPDPGATSRVRSRFLAMELDHDSGEMWGRVVAGVQSGADLADLGEDESRQLYLEISSDSDSLALFETWLDKYRDGWRAYFGSDAQDPGDKQASGLSGVEEAYAILGLEPGASDEDIHKAHRRVMKNVHPDHGGSTYLASKVNEARDLLLGHKR